MKESIVNITKIPGKNLILFLKNVNFPAFEDLFLQKLENKNKIRASKKITRFDYEKFHQKINSRNKIDDEEKIKRPLQSLEDNLDVQSCVSSPQCSADSQLDQTTDAFDKIPKRFNRLDLKERLDEKKKQLKDEEGAILTMQSPPIRTRSTRKNNSKTKTVFKSQIVPDNDSCDEDLSYDTSPLRHINQQTPVSLIDESLSNIYKTPVNSDLKIVLNRHEDDLFKKSLVKNSPVLVSPAIEKINVDSPVVFKSPNKNRISEETSNESCNTDNPKTTPLVEKNFILSGSSPSLSMSSFSSKSNIKNAIKSLGSNSIKSFSAVSNILSLKKKVTVYDEDEDELLKEEDEKRELLFKFQLLKQKHEHLVSAYSFNMRSDIKVMRNTYKLIIKELSVSSRVDNFQTYLLAGFIFIEIGLGKFGFDMEGFSKQQIESIKSYDELLSELGERDYTTSFTKKWPVEFRLCAMIAFNAVMFIIAKSLQGNKQLNFFGLLNSSKSSATTNPVFKLDRSTNSKQMKGLNGGEPTASL